ncbi:MAG: hypothetical protein JNK25_02400 [Phycisphaerae bacterium]|nr:hypothetical protein [Phycisphaerae bacterium]
MATGWTWLDDKLQDGADIAEALRLGISHYAFDAAKRRLGEGFDSLIRAIVPSILTSLAVVGGAAALGAGLGAAAGSLAGGIGAAPGAVGGASLGASAGLTLLTFLGVGFLVKYVADRLGELADSFDKGATASRRANGAPTVIDTAARHFGDAMGGFVALVIEGLIMYFAARGMRAGINKVKSTRLGQTVANAAANNPAFINRVRLQRYCNELGWSRVTGTMRLRVSRAAAYLEKSGVPDKDMVGYLKAIDFKSEVKVVSIEANTMLIQRKLEKVGRWYTRPGVSGRNTGISEAGRSVMQFKTTRPVQALESRAAATGDIWTPGRHATHQNHAVKLEQLKGLSKEQIAKMLADHQAYVSREVVSGGGVQYFTNAPIPVYKHPLQGRPKGSR